MGLIFRHILGVRFCPRCPECALSDSPCMDAFGSSATPWGGVFGRLDAIIGSLETQKVGTYHIHMQLFAECLHQFTPLSELVRLDKKVMLEQLRKYSDYTAHVSRTIYCEPEACRAKQKEVEDGWPEYRNSHLMLSRPAYQSDLLLDANDWSREYLARDVEQLQMHKQHHVHIPDAQGVRRPLEHCKDPKNPEACKAGFPRDSWLTDELLLICPGLAEDRDMPYTGKRTMVGLLWGPCNDPNLNGNHPALLASARCNGDVQLPYRFPITEDTHNHWVCDHGCDEKMPVWQLVQAAEAAQRAQAGYACDYQNKRLPIAVHECKAWMSGQQSLYEELKGSKLGYLGARVVKRLITDCYGKGVVRGAVEIANLILQNKDPDPTKAESVKTALMKDISLKYPTELLQAVAAGQPWPVEPRRAQVDKRDFCRRRLADCPPWTLYGARGAHERVHHLSAYEFAQHYYFKLGRRPLGLKQHEDQQKGVDDFHAALTDAGKEKLAQGNKHLVPGEDYAILEEGGESWTPLGNGQHAKAYRHDWVVARQPRPSVPVVYGANASKTQDDQAKRILVLFFPWVNDEAEASLRVPFLSRFWQPGVGNWTEALRLHAANVGFPTQEVKTLTLNFIFTYCLPRQLALTDGLEENSDNEGLVDDLEDLDLDEDELLEATTTFLRGSGAAEQMEGEEEGEPAADAPAGQSTKLHDMTADMLRLSDTIWHGEQDSPDPEARARRLRMQTSADSVLDHEAALQAAKAGLKAKKPRAGGLAGDVDEGDVQAGRPDTN